jgi:quercetin dioxygenase-like cupin family protein
LSKQLLDGLGATQMEFRISTYAPMAYVECHTHKVQEQVYYVIEGQGLFEMDGASRVVGPHEYIFIPPGALHGFRNTGLGPLTFLLATSPAVDE